jgi:hypothetical protein
MQIPMALKAGDYNSIKDRGQLINLIAETNRAQDYIAVRRTEGLTLYDTSPNDEPMRCVPYENGGYIYYVAGENLYRFLPPSGDATVVGAVGGAGQAVISSNSVPGANQLIILNGYIYESGSLSQITDPDFYDSTSVTILNERFWLTRDGTNEFFASDVADGSAYNPLSFATAEWKPDNVRRIVSKKSALWIVGSSTSEYWQSVDDSILPVRAVRGASLDIGILADGSFAELDDYFAFLADNSNIALITGTELTYISDLTLTRSSMGGLAWRGLYAITYQNNVYMGDLTDGSIWIFDPDAKTEGDNIQPVTMITPSISFKKDAYISCINVEMEVGVAETPSANPLMIVYNSKDGGKNWILHSHVPLGGWGEYRKRVPIRNFGRLVRFKDFKLKFVITDPVRVQFYDIDTGDDGIDFDA